MSTLTALAFEQLLFRLDTNQTRAAEKYEQLRLKLVKCLNWKGCPESEADTLADTVLDRLASKIAQGEQIQNVTAYACEIMRYVWLEHIRKHKEDAVGEERMPEVVTEINQDEIFQETDARLQCLRRCMADVVPDKNDQRLITGYYDMDAGDKLKNIRKALAAELSLSMPNLKVRACRLRERLEECINECMRGLRNVTKSTFPITNNQGGNLK